MSGLLLKVGYADDGRMLAIAYEMSGEDTLVQDVEVVKDITEARIWFAKVSLEKPWIERQ